MQLTHFLPWIFFSLIFNGAIIFLWQKKVYDYIGVGKYKAIQRIHLLEIPRLGGFVILSSITGFGFFSASLDSASLINLMLLILSPSLFFALKEDLYHNVKPFIRFKSILLSGFLFVFLYRGPWPEISIPVIGNLLSTQLGIFIFYPLAIAAVTNGMNLIDGVNGLCAMAAISILSSLLFLSYNLADTFLIEVIILLIFLIVIFLFFNYPKGFIFLGDLGAYSLGIITSILTIIFYGRHPEIPSWGGALIVVYPLTEVAFTLFRRVKSGVPSYKPDLSHLHLKLYLFFKSHPSFKVSANSFVMPSLSLLWLYPLLAVFFFHQDAQITMLSIISFVFLYLLIYKKISNK